MLAMDIENIIQPDEATMKRIMAGVREISCAARTLDQPADAILAMEIALTFLICSYWPNNLDDMLIHHCQTITRMINEFPLSQTRSATN